MNLNEKEAQRFNPIDAFPGDIVIFNRVIDLLRGLSSTLDARVVYLEIMRPFAESVLQCNVNIGPAFNENWIHDSPVLSDVENKLRKLIIELGNENKVLGIQVCAYKDGEVIIDTSAGILGRYDRRPVQPDTLFPVFSASKGITAGMVHWLVDKGKLKLEDRVESIWPEFGSNGKEKIKVHHVLNHTSGLQNALTNEARENPLLLTDWNWCLDGLASAATENEPGSEQQYHYFSFGWLCGGIIERASGKKFQEVLEEAFVKPLNVEGELYIGIPPGVESRLATVSSDAAEIEKFSETTSKSSWHLSPQQQEAISRAGSALPLFNTLQARRAVIPAANAHCSARALARYYAALAARGKIPPLPHSSSGQPQLGSHAHVPKFSPPKPTNNNNNNNNNNGELFTNSEIHDEFLGAGEYEGLAFAGGALGLGFRRSYSEEGEMIGFGHSGMGGSTGYCDVKNGFAIAVTLNKMNMGGVTEKVMGLVCSQLGIPLPKEFTDLQIY